MRVFLKYLVKSPAGTFLYRRAVPPELRAIIGARELKRSLDTRDAEVAAQRWAAVHRWAEDELTKARARPSIDPDRVAARYLATILAEEQADLERRRQKPPSVAADDEQIVTFDDEDDAAAIYGASEDPPMGDAVDMWNPPNPEWVRDEVARLAGEAGIRQKPGTKGWNATVEKLRRAVILGDKIPYYLSAGRPLPDEITRLTEAGSVMTLSEARDEWIKRPDKAQKPQKTISEVKRAANWFIEVNGDKPVTSIKRHEVMKWRDVMLSNGRSVATAKKLIFYLRSIISAATESLENFKNPADNVPLPKSDSGKRMAFTDDFLKEFFKLQIFVNPDLKDQRSGALFWLPIVSLLTGARQAEIIQLYNEDVYEEGGVYIIDVNTGRKGQMKKLVKNKSSIRRIPVPQKLIDIGFVEFAQSKRGRLFDIPADSHGVPAGLFSKWIADYIDLIDDEPSLVFHSFRHTFLQRALRAGVPTEHRNAIVGHMNRATEFADYNAMDGVPWPARKAEIDKVTFPSVDFAPIKKAAKLFIPN